MRNAFIRVTLLFLTLAIMYRMGISQSTETDFGILRSMDNGKSWKQVFRGNLTVDNLAIDGHGRILASSMIDKPKGIDSELYVSGPTPEQWRKVLLPGIDPHHSMIYDLITAPDGSVLALLKGKIFRTDDGGITWTVIAPTLPANFVSFMTGPNLSLLAFPSQGVYQSIDNGENWHFSGWDDQKMIGKTLLGDGSFLISSDCKLYTDSISQEHPSELFIPEDSCPGYDEFAADAKGSIYANTSHGVFKSDAAGKHWEKVLTFQKEVSPFGIEVAPNGDLFALDLIGISRITLFRSEDAGLTWKMIQKLSAGVTISKFAYSPNGAIYAGLTSFGD